MKRAALGFVLSLSLCAGVGAQQSGPQRLADGSVFLPKPAQRQLGVRTSVVAEAELPRIVELNGSVVIDPNAGGKVQALLAGRLEAGPRGLPGLGQAVRKGEVLAWVVPSAGQFDSSGQAAQIAELRAAQSLADKRLARLRELADTVPRKEIEALESERAGLAGRIAALQTGLARRDALVAPVSGVIASANAVAGQVVDARELVFEVVDPQRLRIEALAFDPAIAADIDGGAIAIGDTRIELAYVGAGRALRDQALPLVFGAEGAALAQLAVGQPVKVFVRTRSTTRGVVVASTALVRNPSNQTIVWVKTAPERFEPHAVVVAPLDGVNVIAISGLAAGMRVATRGATLINQTR